MGNHTAVIGPGGNPNAPGSGDEMKAAEHKRLAKIAAAAAGQVMPEQPGVTHSAPGVVHVEMDTRTGATHGTGGFDVEKARRDRAIVAKMRARTHKET